MGSFSDEDDDDDVSVSTEGECRFFDAEESIAASGSESESDLDLACCSSTAGLRGGDSGLGNFLYDFWIRSPRSVRERRNEFLSWMGVNNLNRVPRAECSGDIKDDHELTDDGSGINRITEKSGAVLRNSVGQDEFSSSRSNMSSWSSDVGNSMRKSGARGNFLTSCKSDCRIYSNGYPQAVICDGRMNADNFLDTSREGQGSATLHSVSQRHVDIRCGGNSGRATVGLRGRLLRRIRSMTCMMSQPGHLDNWGIGARTKVQRIKVRKNKKRVKELSALFKGQSIQAHEGSILAMKFSPDGQYLASAGEDKVVRVWQVLEDDRANDIDIPDMDPSCLYFTVNHLSELAPLVADKEKNSNTKCDWKSSESACLIFPPKVFRILEDPLHEFQGHTGEVLDISWSNSNCLLSSSVDKTVRMWKVGCDQCLGVFSHSNYVTCAQFNPVNDNYFVTGSIDGKVRIWEISACRVIDWCDIRDIITAVCYRPDGEGGIVGTITGICRFFTASDNRLQLEGQICLTAKKKSPCKKITSFQFFPKDSSKVLVTCADSQVRVLSGGNVIRKYKGPRSAGNQICASFTSDGKHMISSSEDSSVYIWNSFNLDDDFFRSQPKTIRSFECFRGDASVVAPWSGLKRGNSGEPYRNLTGELPFSPGFSLGQEFFLESIPRGSATWPEEKLPDPGSPTVASIMSKSQFKFLKTSFQRSSGYHAWGMVIVTAGWDGRIRSFHNYGLPIAT
ncbi:OLC1v1020871C1 [Oldenlandia corymbosa var. corymbosa]|uniref:OLC1v1020871C1 n=1 Tax=Oldenlandia corymbosa var. corymbosa TaxID=529605 RepID=A0AAV1BVW4_OLDCO|nr:OLC1v1020871C1 [Oldenlandia corymbosa var. corymbosa]